MKFTSFSLKTEQVQGKISFFQNNNPQIYWSNVVTTDSIKKPSPVKQFILIFDLSLRWWTVEIIFSKLKGSKRCSVFKMYIPFLPFPFPIFVDLWIEWNGPCCEIYPSNDLTEYLQSLRMLNRESNKGLLNTAQKKCIFITIWRQFVASHHKCTTCTFYRQKYTYSQQYFQ